MSFMNVTCWGPFARLFREKIAPTRFQTFSPLHLPLSSCG